MSDRIDACSLIRRATRSGVARVADHELRAFGHSPGEAGGEIVENDDRLAGVEKARAMWPPI